MDSKTKICLTYCSLLPNSAPLQGPKTKKNAGSSSQPSATSLTSYINWLSLFSIHQTFVPQFTRPLSISIFLIFHFISCRLSVSHESVCPFFIACQLGVWKQVQRPIQTGTFETKFLTFKSLSCSSFFRPVFSKPLSTSAIFSSSTFIFVTGFPLISNWPKLAKSSFEEAILLVTCRAHAYRMRARKFLAQSLEISLLSQFHYVIFFPHSSCFFHSFSFFRCLKPIEWYFISRLSVVPTEFVFCLRYLSATSTFLRWQNIIPCFLPSLG